MNWQSDFKESFMELESLPFELREYFVDRLALAEREDGFGLYQELLDTIIRHLKNESQKKRFTEIKNKMFLEELTGQVGVELLKDIAQE